ncbi:MAG: PadR family transcriptional regulator [Acidimicrobiia bacterium]|jgi:DNA-binding PadR family transcriptional regulator
MSRAAFLILMSLADRPRHGLAIVDWIDDASGGEVAMGPGTLYGTLQKLVASGLIRHPKQAPDPDDDDPRRRYYELTPKGQRTVRAEAERLKTLVKAASKQKLLGNI